MSLATAKGAITALRSKSAMDAAYLSYAAGHDDKHRCAAKAYAANHDAADPNAPQGYYQKTGIIQVETGTVMKSVWNKPPTPQPVFSPVATLSDISTEEEKDMLWSSIYMATPAFYENRDADKFLFAVGIPAGYAGLTFEGGGSVFPKRSSPCATMVLVIATGGSNIQLVTHFPASADFLGRQAAMT